MGEIENMIASEVMEPPGWPRCARCGVELVERTDPETGNVVREGSKALFECPRCHEIVIGTEPRRQMNRYRLIRRLLVASGCAGGAGMLIYRVLLQDGPGGLRDLGFFVMMVVLAGMGICLQFGLDAAARALTPRNSADARVTWWAYVVFWAAVVAMQGWLMVRVGWPMITKHGSAVGQTAARGPAD